MLPILLALVFIAILFVVFLTGQPDEFIVTRSVKMAASPEGIFPNVNELRRWDAWSPWAKLDPNCKMTCDGPPAGVGASYAWSGNKKVGEGRLTIIESRAAELVRIKLEFLKPFKATNTAEFVIKSEGGRTAVAWSMFGKTNFMSKAFGLFMNCDKMIGGDFEKGLAHLKTVVETTSVS